MGTLITDARAGSTIMLLTNKTTIASRAVLLRHIHMGVPVRRRASALYKRDGAPICVDTLGAGLLHQVRVDRAVQVTQDRAQLDGSAAGQCAGLSDDLQAANGRLPIHPTPGGPPRVSSVVGSRLHALARLMMSCSLSCGGRPNWSCSICRTASRLLPSRSDCSSIWARLSASSNRYAPASKGVGCPRSAKPSAASSMLRGLLFALTSPSAMANTRSILPPRAPRPRNRRHDGCQKIALLRRRATGHRTGCENAARTAHGHRSRRHLRGTAGMNLTRRYIPARLASRKHSCATPAATTRRRR